MSVTPPGAGGRAENNPELQVLKNAKSVGEISPHRQFWLKMLLIEDAWKVRGGGEWQSFSYVGQELPLGKR